MTTKRVRVRVGETCSRSGYAVVEVPAEMPLSEVPRYVMNEIGYGDNVDWTQSWPDEDSLWVDQPELV